MPILWRYLLRNYFQVFLLCVSSFIAILLVTRFQEIAKFAAITPQKIHVLFFILYQIPYILPIAIPISCLLSSFLLFQKMSHSHELTSLRACGLSLQSIAYPLLFASAFLGILNSHIISELTPLCRGLSKELVYQMTSINPLFLFQKDAMIKVKHTFVDMKSMQVGENAKDVIFVINNQSSGRLSMIVAEKLSLEKGLLIGKNVSIVTSAEGKDSNNFDHVVVENQKLMTTQDSALSQFVQITQQQLGYEHIPFRMIFGKYQAEKEKDPSSALRLGAEISRRISFGCAPFTFAFIGATCGIHIGRNRSKKRFMWALLLSSLCLISFVIAKSLKQWPLASLLLYLAPHPFIIWFSLKSLLEISRGKE